MTPITVQSRRFGALEVAREEIVDFPDGLIGLPGRRYVVVAAGPASPFAWLQSADDPDLALPVTEPWRFFGEHRVDLSGEATDGAVPPVSGEGVRVWVTVRAAGRLEDFSANLRAPIVVHEGRGRQVINAAPDAPVRAPLFGADAFAA